MTRLGEGCRAQPDRARDIRPVRAHHRLDDVRLQRCCAERRLDAGIGAEHHQPRPVVLLFFHRRQQSVGRLLFRAGDTLRTVHQEIDIHPVLRFFPLQPGEGQHHRRHHQHSQAKRQHASPPLDVDIRFPRKPTAPSQYQRQRQQPKRMGHL